VQLFQQQNKAQFAIARPVLPRFRNRIVQKKKKKKLQAHEKKKKFTAKQISRRI